jgi:hypothetical protein
MTDIAFSNSLTDLAARIKAEHTKSQTAIKRGLGHAIAAGHLLNEAKAQLKHGQWLPWLQDHCGVPVRSAQRYMELAAYAEIKSDNLAHLAIDACADAVPIERLIETGDWEAAGDRMLNGPFTFHDVEPRDDDGHDWMFTKLLHQTKVPAIASWCITVPYVNGHPPLRLCPWDELIETVRALGPVAAEKKGGPEVPIRFAADTFDNMVTMGNAIWVVRMWAIWLVGNALNEMDYRKTISDERYASEYDEIHAQVMARLESKLDALRTTTQ